MQRDYSVSLSIDAYGTEESVADDFREYANGGVANYELTIKPYRKRDWGFEIDPDYEVGSGRHTEPVIVGDRVAWYTKPSMTGTVILVGPSRQGYPRATPMVAVLWDDPNGLNGAGSPVTVEDRELVYVIKKADRVAS